MPPQLELVLHIPPPPEQLELMLHIPPPPEQSELMLHTPLAPINVRLIASNFPPTNSGPAIAAADRAANLFKNSLLD